MKVAIIGAGWAGLAAMVGALRQGDTVSLFESARHLGGRARGMPCTLPDGATATLDNGQHILIGAYHACWQVMRQVGVDPAQAFLRMPLTLRFDDGSGIRFPDWPAPWDAAAGILGARGWRLGDKLALARRTLAWRRAGFTCDAQRSVSELCQGLPARVLRDLIEPLCVSALNTPAPEASATVFLRVMRDSVFAGSGDSQLMLPRQDLSAVFPAAAARWGVQQGAELRLGVRVRQLACHGSGWQVDGEDFDRVVLATGATEAARLLQAGPEAAADPQHGGALEAWCSIAEGLRHNPITTVYAWAPGASLPEPMLALRSTDPLGEAPAQFAFDRGRLGGPQGLIAFVVSASDGDREALQARVLAQAARQCGLALQPLQTIVEKRATFRCTPGLQRPPMAIAPGLHACGDYVEGPYPATLEGAVRSGLAAIRRS